MYLYVYETMYEQVTNWYCSTKECTKDSSKDQMLSILPTKFLITLKVTKVEQTAPSH